MARFTKPGSLDGHKCRNLQQHKENALTRTAILIGQVTRQLSKLGYAGIVTCLLPPVKRGFENMELHSAILVDMDQYRLSHAGEEPEALVETF